MDRNMCEHRMNRAVEWCAFCERNELNAALARIKELELALENATKIPTFSVT